MFLNNTLPNLMFTLIPVLVFCGFAFVITMFIVMGVKGIIRWQSNNKQPILIVPANLVSKRINVSRRMHNNAGRVGHSSSSSTDYYITFEVESGSRMEFEITGQEYGLLVEKDHGDLKFQGTRYLGFERN
ncbi:MAG: DUF2500 domain-containing protein [Firmicutes bacterium HGW-Firmicutes-7]|nr:MAG: DUF2500 domain-containing protein [Firmicutes bacterium HGW-Firmicutes-7]